MAANTWIHEGDWFITKRSTQNRHGHSRPQCFEYRLNPRDGWGIPANELKVRNGEGHVEPLPCSTYIGPVHGEPEEFNGYITVRVPSYWNREELVWVNVRRDNVDFADRVTDKVRRRWTNRGWTNWIYLDPHR